jgi:demethylmenaquinone methyltransferase/2-methoxy-6-polyprenyl-1,4-benzoquinol methylase
MSSNYDFDQLTATPERKKHTVHSIFAGIADNYDLMNDVESFGLHRHWKHELLEQALQHLETTQGSAVLDVATGTGDIALKLVQHAPAAQITGLDFSAEMLEVAKERARATLPLNWQMKDGRVRPQRANLRFVQGDAMAMPFASASFDVVTISFGLRNMPSYEGCCRECWRVLKPGGLLLILDASYPTHPLVVRPFKLYFKHLMPKMANAIVHKDDEYHYLHDSVEAFLTKDELVGLLGSCGFEGAGYRSFMCGAAALHRAEKPAACIAP